MSPAWPEVWGSERRVGARGSRVSPGERPGPVTDPAVGWDPVIRLQGVRGVGSGGGRGEKGCKGGSVRGDVGGHARVCRADGGTRQSGPRSWSPRLHPHPKSQRDLPGPNPGAACLARRELFSVGRALEEKVFLRCLWLLPSETAGNLSPGMVSGFTTETFKQERSFREVHVNNSLREEMGSYQPTVPHGPSEYFLRALHRIFPSVTTLDRDTFIQTEEKRERKIPLVSTSPTFLTIGRVNVSRCQGKPIYTARRILGASAESQDDTF